jgi:hypothetical protein
MTKADFVDWKSHPVTKQVFTSLQGRIYDLQVELGYSAGSDQANDNRRVGAIQALRDVLTMDFDEETQE